MKQKKFKIEGTTLFVYRSRLNNKGGIAAMPTNQTDPTTVALTTTLSTGFFPK